MVGKALWGAIAAGLAATAALVARQLASALWRLAAKEEPPAKR